MIILVKKRFLYLCAFAAVSVSVLCLALRPAFVPAGLGSALHPQICYVIDAGHGGEDGGAVAADGTAESEINLAVARRLEALLTFFGAETSMTRMDEKAIYDEGAATLREKKRSDLKNRVDIANAEENGTLVSIHQNSLPSSANVHGAQVFFAPTVGSDALAKSIQKVLNNSINFDNPKEEKAISSSVYLMSHVDCRAVLVECGFLSNAAETEQLKTDEHQKRLAVTIAAGILLEDHGKRG